LCGVKDDVGGLAMIVNYGGEDLGFQGMTAGPLDTRSLIDEFLRDHEFSAAYEIRIDRPPSVVYRSLLRSDFGQAWLVRRLMALRAGKRMRRQF
jgi:hypothetical protein